MRKRIAHQTLLTLVAWLLLQNFNLSASESGSRRPATSAGNRPAETEWWSAGGKSTTSRCTANSNVQFSAGNICCPLPTGPCLLPTAHCPLPTGAYRIKKIVLDAGHGGKDPGCIGAASKEKHNALAIVLKLGALIKAEFPEVEVIYTRETDVFIELNERAAIANRNNADLFISVHCNSISVSRVKGAETYVMGLHTAQHNLEVAKRENASIFLEDNYQKNYGGYDPNSPEAHIFGSVLQSAYLEQSILFAGYVQKYASEIAGREDKGVKQAGFLVLRETAMPAVLVEAGYLTNRAEEAFIASDEGQAQMAESIFEAFRAYKSQLEGTPFAARPRRAPVQADAKPAQPIIMTASTKTPVEQPAVTAAKRPAGSTTTHQTAAPAHYPTQQSKGVSQDAYADEIPLKAVSKMPAADGFRIFLMSWPSRLDKNAGQLALLGDVVEEKSAGQFQYFTGKFATRGEAEKMLPELFNLGFRTAKVEKLNAQPN